MRKTLIIGITLLLSVSCLAQADILDDGFSDADESIIQDLSVPSEVILDDSIEENGLIIDENIVSLEAVGSTLCPGSFYFSAGAGMSGMQVKINQDWSFMADSHDGEMIRGEGYSYTVYFQRVFGQLGEPRKLNEYSYSFSVLSYAPQYEEGYKYIEGDTLYYSLDTKGLVDTDQFLLYLPGTPVSVFSEDDMIWVSRFVNVSSGRISGGYILKNPGTGMIFVGRMESEENRLVLPSSDDSVKPTPTITPTPSPTPSFSHDIQPEVTGFYNSVKGADLRWTTVPGAQGYYIYRKRSADGTKKIAAINDPSATQYFDSEIQNNCWGRVYVYYIVPFSGNEKGEASTQVTLQRLAPMKFTSAVNESVGSVDLAWSCSVNENKALGYEIQYATSKEDLFGQKGSFRKVSVKGRNKLFKTITDLTAGDTYFFRIRCYVNYTHSVTGKQTKTWSQYSDLVQVQIQQ